MYEVAWMTKTGSTARTRSILACRDLGVVAVVRVAVVAVDDVEELRVHDLAQPGHRVSHIVFLYRGVYITDPLMMCTHIKGVFNDVHFYNYRSVFNYVRPYRSVFNDVQLN